MLLKVVDRRVAQKSRDTFRDGTILEYLTYLTYLGKKVSQIQISLFQAAEGVKKFAEEFL